MDPRMMSPFAGFDSLIHHTPQKANLSRVFPIDTDPSSLTHSRLHRMTSKSHAVSAIGTPVVSVASTKFELQIPTLKTVAVHHAFRSSRALFWPSFVIRRLFGQQPRWPWRAKFASPGDPFRGSHGQCAILLTSAWYGRIGAQIIACQVQTYSSQQVA